jgi:UDP-N-acetylglucosamine transferase subunit ALG13
MILVAVGASQFPFDRLLRAVDAISERATEPLVVQHGPSTLRPRRARCVPYVPTQQLAQLVAEARVVVTHAGVGSILLSLSNGKRPYVVPRRRVFDETVDDHQLECARRFAQAGLVDLIEDPSDLAEAIARPSAPIDLPDGSQGALAHELRLFLAETIGPPTVTPR